MMILNHAELRDLKPPEVATVLDWIAADDPRPEPPEWITSCQGTGDAVWLLAHCDDGVTWGKVSGSQLALSCDAFEAWPTPRPDRKRLQTLRLFGLGGEVLLWRAEGAGASPFAGRLLGDETDPPADCPTAPKTQVYLLSADRIAPGGNASAGFTVVQDRAGRTQVVPLDIAEDLFGKRQYRLGLKVCHYFELDDATGCVRIAASRLVGLEQLTATADDKLIVSKERE